MCMESTANRINYDFLLCAETFLDSVQNIHTHTHTQANTFACQNIDRNYELMLDVRSLDLSLSCELCVCVVLR